MSQNQKEVSKETERLSLVYVVTSYGNIIGVYSSQTDAVQIQSLYIAKGRLCDLVVKPVLYPEISNPLNSSK